MSPSASLLHSSILDQLGLVADMTRIFALDPDDSDALSVGLSQVAKHVRAEAASLFLLENNATELVCRACFGPVDITGLRLPAETGIVGRTVAENAAQSVRDVANDPDFGAQVDEKTGFTTRSILCAPLSVRDERLGAIEVINKTGFADQPGDGLFDEEDLKLLEVLAASTALALSNSRLTVSAFEQERLAREVELAAEIQRGLLPALGAPEAAIHGINLPARDVSGDFFDHLVDPMGRLWFCVGDVSGKGMNAALMMAKTASLFRVLARTSASPGRLLDVINAELCETAARGMFVTMVAGCVESDRETVVLANAGHEPPLLLSAQDHSFASFPAEAPPLGILPTIAGPEGFPELAIPLGDGTLYLFTDGITEARTPDGALLGTEHLMTILQEGASLSGPEQITRLVDELETRGMERRDDLTLLILSGAVLTNQQIETTPSTPGSDCAETALAKRSDPFKAFAQDAGAELVCNLTLQAKADRLKAIRAMVRSLLEPSNWSDVEGADQVVDSREWVEELILAVDEACQNVVRHAYGGVGNGRMRLSVYLLDLVDHTESPEKTPIPAVGIRLRDFAPTVDPSTICPRDLDDIRPGGLGTHFMQCLTDHLRYRPPTDGLGNVLEMIKRIPLRSQQEDPVGAGSDADLATGS